MNQQRPPPPQGQSQQQQGPSGSKQGTPQPQQNLGPPQQQTPSSGNAVEMSATPGPTSDTAAAPPPPVASKPTLAAVVAQAPAAQQSSKPSVPQKSAASRVAVPLAPSQRSAAAQQPATTAPGQPQSFADATQAATAAVAAAMAKLGTGKPQQQTDGATDNLTQKVQQMRINDQQQRGSTRGSRARGGPPRGGARGKAIEVPKEDFDFESSNAKFNKQDLVKEAIATGSPNPVGSPNGETADPIANGHAATEDEDVVIPPAEKGYDKKSSFFDNISSDLKDRVEQSQGDGNFDGRAMRAQERSKNMDTFGQSNVEGGYRGGYRGRGRGYNNGFRGRGAYRGRYGGIEARGRGRGRGGDDGSAAATVTS